MLTRMNASGHYSNRRSRALIEATGRRHWAGIAADKGNRSCIRRFFDVFHHKTHRKRLLVEAKAPINNRGMTYQNDEKDINNLS